MNYFAAFYKSAGPNDERFYGKSMQNFSCFKFSHFKFSYWHEVITTDCVYKDGKYRQMALIGFVHKPLNLGYNPDWWAWTP